MTVGKQTMRMVLWTCVAAVFSGAAAASAENAVTPAKVTVLPGP